MGATNYIPKEKFGVVLPSYNEEKTVGRTLERLQEVLPNRREYRILVSDGGSDDRTVEIARERGAGVLELEERVGKGESVVWGLRKLLKDPEIENFVVMDSDGDFDPKRIPSFLKELERSDTETVFGYNERATIFGKFLNKLSGYEETWGVGIEAFDRETTKEIADSGLWDYMEWNIDVLMTMVPHHLNKEIKKFDVVKGEAGESKFQERKHQLLLGLPVVFRVTVHGIKKRLSDLVSGKR